ncbi:hypothetical protein ACFY2Q_21880 [Micromonospora sp. NPDC000316]|uniref:hypothetical protein n=1 Tax=Micromonospora sp. NPDC000316 TaxID=3364216 RepID=UPI0036BC9E71
MGKVITRSALTATPFAIMDGCPVDEFACPASSVRYEARTSPSHLRGSMSIMTNRQSNIQRLVYGHATMHGCLAFADANTATEEAAEIRALAAVQTWGEARQVQMTHLWNPAGPEYHEPDDG